MKKQLALFLSGLMVCTSLSFAKGINVYVNGNKINAEAYIDNASRTLVPIRFVADNLGINTKWDNESKTATVTQDDKVVEICIPCKKVRVNGTEVATDSYGSLKNSRTYVPLRFIAENFDAIVKYEKGNVYINTKNYTSVSSIELPEMLSFEEQQRTGEVFKAKRDSGRNYKLPVHTMKELDKSIIPDSTNLSLKKSKNKKLYDGSSIEWGVEIEGTDTEFGAYENFYLTYIRGNGKMLRIITTDGEWINPAIADGDSAHFEGSEHFGKVIDKCYFSNGIDGFLVDIPDIKIVPMIGKTPIGEKQQ